MIVSNKVFKCGVVLVLFSLTSCTQPILNRSQPNNESVVTEDEIAPAEQPLLKNEISALLGNAEAAFSKDRLLRPKEDNAFLWYRKVLRIDENNPRARRGMHEITERYFQLAEQLHGEGRYDRALLMLDRAERVSAKPEELTILRLRFQPPLPAKNEFRLPIGSLNARNDDLLKYLDQLTVKVLTARSRLLIVARSDEEGRWIYRQMRSFAGGYRLRGDIKIGSIPAVVLLDFDAS